MNSKIVILLVIFTILFGCALCGDVESESTIQLNVFESSTKWWIAVLPTDDRYDTVVVEVREAGSLQWVQATHNPDWGYFQLPSQSGRGFVLPLTFRFTADNGDRVVTGSFMNSIVGGATLDTGVQYAVEALPTAAPSTSAPTRTPSVPSTTSSPSTTTSSPSTTPSPVATEAPTQSSSEAPTQEPGSPTEAPTPTVASALPTVAAHAPTHAAQVPTQAAPVPTVGAPVPTVGAPVPTVGAPVPTVGAPVPTVGAPAPVPTKAPTVPPTTAPENVDLCAIVSPAVEPTRIMVPLYVYPGSAWDELIAVAQTGIQIMAVINPSSGPDYTGPDSAYKTYIQKLLAANIVVIGYVHTSWGARAIATVTNEVQIYKTLYPGVTGIFFDEGAVNATEIPYYEQAYNYVMSVGFTHVILNPGQMPDQGYQAVSTSIVVYEDYAVNLTKYDSADTWITCAPNAAAKANYKYKMTFIIHTATLSDMPALISTAHSKGMGLIYVTDGIGGCCTYNTLTSYFPQEGSTVASLN